MSLRTLRFTSLVPLLLVLTSGCGGGSQADLPADPPLTTTTPSTAAPTESPLVDLVRSDALRPYWHAALPGRVPVRIVANPNSSDRPAFTLLGAPVVWITPEQAEPGSAFLVVDFQLVDGLLNLSVRYPVEGIRASAVYVPSGDAWVRTGPVRVAEE